MKNRFIGFWIAVGLVVLIVGMTSCDLGTDWTAPETSEVTTVEPSTVPVTETDTEKETLPEEETTATECSHVYSEWISAADATCTQQGMNFRLCTVCSYRDLEVIPATGHTEVMDPGKASTCTADGFTDGKHCTKCGEITSAQTAIPALGHTEVTDAGKPATCTESGLTDGKHCTRCGEITLAQTAIPALGHTEVTDAGKPATCTESGLTDGRHCTTCNAVTVVQVLIPAKGHTEVVDVGREPTCTDNGLTDGKHCTTCGEITEYQGIIITTGHNEVTVPRVEPTCTEQGKTESVVCSVCRLTLSGGTPLAALGHAVVIDPRVEPTCTETGLSEGKHCGDCGLTVMPQRTLPALGHHAVTIPMKPATCTEGGLTEGSLCDRCDLILEEQTVTAPLGHSYQDNGLCIRCDHSLASEGLTFLPQDDGTCYLAGLGSCTDAHVIIPSVSPDGDTVVGIYGYVFEGVRGITAVTVPNTVTTMGSICNYLEESVEVYFMGSRSEWYTATRYDDYPYNVYARYVHCADGDVFACGSVSEDPRFEFTSNGDGTCYVSGIGTATRGVIPRYSPAGDLVVAIGEDALAGAEFTVVGIPDSVTRIETNAFRNAGFETIVISDSVTYIGDRAFYQLSYSWATQEVCDAIGQLTNLTYLGKYALASGSNEGNLSLTLPEGVTSVEDGLLSGGYYSDRVLVIPKSVTYIGKSIFAGWRTAASITYHGTVAEWRALKKHADWDMEMYPITITCTDGQVVTEDRHTPLD